MNNQKALNPQNSVVVEACAGSGKTWLLVSRIVRLLLDGVQPGELLAIMPDGLIQQTRVGHHLHAQSRAGDAGAIARLAV